MTIDGHDCETLNNEQKSQCYFFSVILLSGFREHKLTLQVPMQHKLQKLSPLPRPNQSPHDTRERCYRDKNPQRANLSPSIGADNLTSISDGWRIEASEKGGRIS